MNPVAEREIVFDKNSQRNSPDLLIPSSKVIPEEFRT
jgi:hypothetical protein